MKDRTDFSKNSHNKDGLRSYCKRCEKNGLGTFSAKISDTMKKFLGVPVPQTVEGRIYAPYGPIGNRNSGAMKHSG